MGRNRLIYSLAEAGRRRGVRRERRHARRALENLKAGWVPLFVREDPDAPDGNREFLDAGGLPITPDELDGDSLLERLGERPQLDYQPTLDETPGSTTSSAKRNERHRRERVHDAWHG